MVLLLFMSLLLHLLLPYFELIALFLPKQSKSAEDITGFRIQDRHLSVGKEERRESPYKGWDGVTERFKRFKWFILTSASAHINIRNTVHKNNAHISLKMHQFPVPQNHPSVHPHNTHHKTASVVGRGGGGGGERGAPLKGRG